VSGVESNALLNTFTEIKQGDKVDTPPSLRLNEEGGYKKVFLDYDNNVWKNVSDTLSPSKNKPIWMLTFVDGKWYNTHINLSKPQIRLISDPSLGAFGISEKVVPF
jgi:hypothetical protein